jgi:hypothetical protein
MLPTKRGQLGKEIASLHATIGADTSGFETGLSNVEKSMLGVRTTIGGLDKNITVMGKNVGSASDAMRSLGINLPITPMAALGTAMTFAVNKTREIVDQTIAYGEQVRKLSEFTGMSNEESSRAIQVADDLRIEYGTLQMAFKTMAQNGIAPNMESLAQLSGQYKALGTDTERSQFLLKNFGKAGIEMAGAMDKGSTAIRSMTSSIADNMIMTEDAIDATNKYQETLDNLNDTWTGLTTSLGKAVLPSLIVGIKTADEYTQRMSKNWWQLLTPVTQAKVGIESFAAAWNSIKNPDKTFADATVTFASMYTMMDEAAASAKKLSGGFDDIGESATSMDLLGLNNNFDVMGTAIETAGKNLAQAKIAENLQKEKDVIDKLNLSMQAYSKTLLFNIASQGLDATAALALAKSMGLVDEKTMAASTITQKWQKDLASGAMTAEQYRIAINALNASISNMKDKTVTVTVRQVGSNIPRDYDQGAEEGGRPTRVNPKTGKTEHQYYDSGKWVWRGMGGPVTAGNVYGVNEKGVEYFIPGTSGYIVPNGGTGTNQNISIMVPVYLDGYQIGRGSFVGTLAEAASRGLKLQAVA